MAEIIDPIITFSIKLTHGYTLRVMVWASTSDMYANTPEECRKDYDAIFIPTNGRCIGTLHLSAHDCSNGVRSHEIRHVVDEWESRVMKERLGRLTEHVTNEIDKTLLGLS